MHTHVSAGDQGRPDVSDLRKQESQGDCEPPDLGAGAIGPYMSYILIYN